MTGSDPREPIRAAARDVLSELLAGVLGSRPANPRLTGPAQRSSAGNGHEDPAVVPQVPAPPVAAVLRPSTWSSPPAPGEVIGDGAPTPTPTRAPAPTPTPAPAPTPTPTPESRSRPGIGDVPADTALVSDGARVEPVTVDTDEDLQRFVRALLTRTENPRDRNAIRTGRLRFTLSRSAVAPSARTAPSTGTAPSARTALGAPGPGPQTAAIRVDKGAVTERVVRQAAAQGGRLVVAAGVVLTPLARDRARALGVEIERERRC